jgi:2-polyprenyl-6-methoxyphenol hydroxylase-like FAD-dependent oxidoreductase
MTDHPVLIVGGGPTGMMLAGELALAGVEALVIERRATQDLTGTRAGGLHARTLELLDQRGIVGRFLAEGQTTPVSGFAGATLDLSDLPTRHPYTLGLRQQPIERLLAGWVAELGVDVHRGVGVTGLAQDDAGVVVTLGDGRTVRASYVVGCDGGRSVVRKAAGIGFPGTEPTISNLIAQAELAEEPPAWGIHRDALGIHSLARVDYTIQDGTIVYADTGPVGVLVTEREVGATAEPTLDDLRAAMRAVWGTDYGIHTPTSIARFTDAARQAASYRSGRVLVAGDAAHIHPPDGGMGLGTGVGDAVNLGWKLAQVVAGISPDTLLDTYHAERHPVGADVVRHALAAAALRRDDERTKALRATVAELLARDDARRTFAATLVGLAARYDLGPGHPLLGRRMPDLDLVTADGPDRVYAHLDRARPLLLHLGQPDALDGRRWADRVPRLDARARADGPWHLPGVGPVPAPTSVLVRPDGHVAWVGEGGDAGLDEALTTWFGEPSGTPPSPRP